MASTLRFDNQVAVVTGAGAGLGRGYALLLASRGARVVVNDVGASIIGEGSDSRTADAVVAEIVACGGHAVANYDSVENGDKIIQTAILSFGRIDILINNAGIIRDASFKNMKDEDWDQIIAVHLKGVYVTTHAAWAFFRKQKYGRIVNTTSASGLYGNFGQTNYSAAKLGLVGLTETLAKEGVKYNILCNAIAPVAATRMTASLVSPEIEQLLRLEWIPPVTAFLVHASNKHTGSVFEVGGGHVAQLRWERAQGALLRCDASMTPGAVLAKWNDINDFSNPDYPTTTQNLVEVLKKTSQLPVSDNGGSIRFDKKVAVVTGAGAGLGRAYALLFAHLGAQVVVNDITNPDLVVQEIRALGGTAVGNKSSVEDGDAVIKTAIDSFGRVDILVNNAGILRDKAFVNMTEKQWDEIMKVHLRGTYKCTKAAYPYMLKQKYGRIVNTTSTSGTYGNYGQANYAAAKCGILGFSRALAIEARKYNIYVNTISPSAGTQLTAGVLPADVVKSRKPEYVAPLVALLCSDRAPEPTGKLYEIGCGWQARLRWQRSGGHTFASLTAMTPEAVSKEWSSITNFDDGRADNPETMEDGRKRVYASLTRPSKI